MRRTRALPTLTALRSNSARLPPRVRPRNDPCLYDDLQHEWWRPGGRFAGLQWVGRARARHIPPPPRPDALLLDVACGAGLLAPWMPTGWRHVGVDLSVPALTQAGQHGVYPVRADVLRLPFPDNCADCVVAGEILEHVADLEGLCAELARVLVPGGTLVLDTIADTWLARIAVIRIAERLPGGPPPGCHDPALLVDPGRLRAVLGAHGVKVTRMNGLRPSALGYLRWLVRRDRPVRMLPVRSTTMVYQALAVKDAA